MLRKLLIQTNLHAWEIWPKIWSPLVLARQTYMDMEGVGRDPLHAWLRSELDQGLVVRANIMNCHEHHTSTLALQITLEEYEDFFYYQT